MRCSSLWLEPLGVNKSNVSVLDNQGNLLSEEGARKLMELPELRAK